MYTCPSCGALGDGALDMCRCGADLTVLRRIDSVADVWFNEALRAASDGHDGLALEWLSAACAARPDDVEARLAQATAWGRLGRFGEARAALERAAAIDPDAPGLQDLRALLNPRPVPVGGGARGKGRRRRTS